MIDIASCQEALSIWASKLKGFKKVKSYASLVLDFAVKNDYLTTNPFYKVVMPTLKKKKLLEDDENFYNANQLVEVLECFQKEGNLKIYSFFNLLAHLGMRRGKHLLLHGKILILKQEILKLIKRLLVAKGGFILGPSKMVFHV